LHFSYSLADVLVKLKVSEVLSLTRNFVVVVVIVIIISCVAAAFLFCVDVFLFMTCYQK